MLTLDRLEFNAMLAGLRLLQAQLATGEQLPPEILEILYDKLPDDQPPPEQEALDNLCMELNELAAMGADITVQEDSP